MFDLEQELKNLPEDPGVYIMHDKDDKIIYVGKAKILKNRVRQYFQKNSNHTPKVLAMVSNVAYFEYIVTDSETEALALECNLIKKHRPKYNILLKDDKHYPYIKVTINEPYPKVLKVRRLLKDGAKYYGPYVSGITIKNTLELVQKLFKPPTCHRKFPDDIRKGRPCLNYHINNCFAPCTGKVSKEEYRQVFFNICRFLDGNHKELIAELTEQMMKASQNMEYEKAADLRDKIQAVKDIEEHQKIINTDKQNDKDVIALAREESVAFCEVFFIRNGKVIVTYSASDTGWRYCMGMLWADENSDLLDIKSWHKSDKPVFKTSEENKQYGPGHNCFTTDNDKDVLIYHSRNYKEIKGDPLHDNNRHARAKVFEYDENGLPIFGEPVPKNI